MKSLAPSFIFTTRYLENQSYIKEWKNLQIEDTPVKGCAMWQRHLLLEGLDKSSEVANLLGHVVAEKTGAQTPHTIPHNQISPGNS